MSVLSPAQAEEALTHLTHQFAQWRQSRTTPRGRIPKSLWAQAVTLAQSLPWTRVGLIVWQTIRPHAPGAQTTPGHHEERSCSHSPPHTPHFVEVAVACRPPTTKVEVQRPDGTRLRVTYNEAFPALAPLLQTFLESR